MKRKIGITTGGDYINNPDVGDYFDLGGSVDSEGIDFHELSDDFDFANETAWRFPLVGNMPNTESNGNEADRSRYADDPDADYSVTDTEVGEWLNYAELHHRRRQHLATRAVQRNQL